MKSALRDSRFAYVRLPPPLLPPINSTGTANRRAICSTVNRCASRNCASSGFTDTRSYFKPAPITAGSRLFIVADANADLIPDACSAVNSVSEYRMAFGTPPPVKKDAPNCSADKPAAMVWRAFSIGDIPYGRPGIVKIGTCHSGPFGHRSNGCLSTSTDQLPSVACCHWTTAGSINSNDVG